MNKTLLKLGICVLSFTLSSAAFAAQSYAELTAAGGAIAGEPTPSQIGGVDVTSMIEGLSFDHKISRDANANH